MELYLCKNKDCLVHMFFGDKGFYSLECPLCNHDDIKNGNRVHAKGKGGE